MKDDTRALRGVQSQAYLSSMAPDSRSWEMIFRHFAVSVRRIKSMESDPIDLVPAPDAPPASDPAPTASLPRA